MNVRLYTPQGIAIGTLLGSLAAGAVMLWLNYRALGYVALANRVAAGGLVLYVVIIVVASMLPDHPGLGVAFIVLQTVVAYAATVTLQGQAIAYHQAQGGGVHSLPRAAGVGFLAGLTVVALLLAAGTLVGTTPG